MKKTFKKAFTLVELVVVIAIIAVVSAVSVGGYFAFIEHAKYVELIDRKDEIQKYAKTIVSNYSYTYNSAQNRHINYVYTPEGLSVTADFGYADSKSITFGLADLFSKNYETKYRIYGPYKTDINLKPAEKNWAFLVTTEISKREATDTANVYNIDSFKRYGDELRSMPALFAGNDLGNNQKSEFFTNYKSDNVTTTVLVKQIGYVSSYNQLIIIDI